MQSVRTKDRKAKEEEEKGTAKQEPRAAPDTRVSCFLPTTSNKGEIFILLSERRAVGVQSPALPQYYATGGGGGGKGKRRN